MNMKQIREIAKTKGLTPGNMKKATLIRAIQHAEGNFECFGTVKSGGCDQTNCLWRADCLK